MKRRRMLQCILVVMLAGVTGYGYAQFIRNFPLESKFGKLKSHAYPQFKIDKEMMVMGAGGQIRDVNNLLIMPAMLNQTGYIRYQIDSMGLVYRIWFLTPEEIKSAKEEEKTRKQSK
ncbi:MAG TPA: hypothetical protein PKM20_02830 [Nitrosomonas sp.]|uniref:hypothetical protein n=1 Tax=Nitrosomonas sp. TaxID=42353 RepID=UPI002600C9BC|nr:hypothetical protein [Nitrosomonas sp.]HNP25651.1 hypothetical protein [Nitrosomonas sp.]